MVAKLTLEEIKERIKNKLRNVVELVEYSGSMLTPSLFLDHEYKDESDGGYFERTTIYLLKGTGRHPKWIQKKLSDGLKDPTRREKIAKTNIERNGGPSPFHSREIQQKVKDNVKEKYGVDNISQLDWVQGKKEDTCFKNYGVANPSQCDEIVNKKLVTMEKTGFKHKGEDSKTLDEIRNGTELRRWRRDVKAREGSICKKCGTNEDVKVHHIYSFSFYKTLRSNADNGICLCDPCHNNFHSIYGRMPLDHLDLVEYLGFERPEWNDLRKIAIQEKDNYIKNKDI